MIVFTIVISLLIFSSCYKTIQDFEKMRESGENTVITIFNYDLEKVFVGAKFVFIHSEYYRIRRLYHMFHFVDEEKFIYYGQGGVVFLSFYFTPLKESKTKMEGVSNGGTYADTMRRVFTDELKYYLENGEEAYKIYTHEEKLKRSKEFEDAEMKGRY